MALSIQYIIVVLSSTCNLLSSWFDILDSYYYYYHYFPLIPLDANSKILSLSAFKMIKICVFEGLI